MGISVYQYPDDPQIIMQKYDNMWTLDEMFESIHQVNIIADSVQDTAFLIVTVPAMSSVPSGILMRGRSVLGEMHNNIATTILVTESGTVQTFYKLFVALFSRIARQKRLHLVQTLDEAFVLIAEYRDANELLEE